MSNTSDRSACCHDHRHGIARRLRAGLTGRAGLEFCARCGSWTACDAACRVAEARTNTVMGPTASPPRA